MVDGNGGFGSPYRRLLFLDDSRPVPDDLKEAFIYEIATARDCWELLAFGPKSVDVLRYLAKNSPSQEVQIAARQLSRPQAPPVKEQHIALKRLRDEGIPIDEVAPHIERAIRSYSHGLAPFYSGIDRLVTNYGREAQQAVATA